MAEFLSPQELDVFINHLNPRDYADENGDVDEEIEEAFEEVGAAILEQQWDAADD
jgi:hypothetical protein